MESDTKKLTDTTKLLRECDAGTKMVISSINEILEKVEDTKLSEILTKSRVIKQWLTLLPMDVIWELNL